MPASFREGDQLHLDSAGQFDPYEQSPDYEARLATVAAIRAKQPVAATSHGWFISSYAGVASALRQPDTFSGVFEDTTGVPLDEVQITALREPHHGRIRRVINSAIAPHKTLPLEPYIRDLARGLMTDVVATARRSGSVELNHAYVDPIPSRVIARALGLPEHDHERFQTWSDDMVSDYAATPSAEFVAYLDDQVAMRRRAPHRPDDVITRLMETEVDRERLSDVAVRTHTMFLIAAGNETTRNLIANTLLRLARHPDLYASVRHDRSLIVPLLEESLRLDAPVQIAGRAVWNDTEIEGCPMHAGDRAVLSYTGANRDPDAFPEPDELRLDRPRVRDHVSFGIGPRICPGASLARLEARVAIEEFADAVPQFELIPEYRFVPKPVFWAWGPQRLDVVID
ncbi:MAG TPA: cytochrome P450 [Acidimicrobiales bacterium]|nr:cytochrome P450 [Acidimicrobiales bacterium]